MTSVIWVSLLGIILLVSCQSSDDDGHGFTYSFLGTEHSVVELKCQGPVFFAENIISTISIYNTTTMMKMAQVIAGRCPTVEDELNSGHLYLPGCSPLRNQPTTSLKVLITKFDATIVQTFLCNITKADSHNQSQSIVWSTTVEQYDPSVTKETDYSSHLWLPTSAYKLLSGIGQDVKLLEPGVVVTVVLMSVNLFSLAVQMFLLCKVIRLLDRVRAPRLVPLSRSQSKMTDHSKTGPLEDEPFYASV